MDINKPEQNHMKIPLIIMYALLERNVIFVLFGIGCAGLQHYSYNLLHQNIGSELFQEHLAPWSSIFLIIIISPLLWLLKYLFPRCSFNFYLKIILEKARMLAEITGYSLIGYGIAIVFFAPALGTKLVIYSAGFLFIAYGADFLLKRTEN